MTALLAVFYLPTHLVLRKVFRSPIGHSKVGKSQEDIVQMAA